MKQDSSKQSSNDELYTSCITLAETIVKILDKKARAGCSNPSWEGYQNGNGTEVGKDIEKLIRKAKRILFKFKTS